MAVNQIFILLAIGLMAGLVSGAMGVGGAIIIVPCLVFFMGLTQHQAQGTSLAVLVFPVGIFAVMNYAKNGFVNIKFAAVLIVAFLLGAYLGSALAVNIPERIMQRIFAVILLFVGAKMLIGK
jgi:uncharacterized membrane protein YfcA